jgi:hypothetical protein
MLSRNLEYLDSKLRQAIQADQVDLLLLLN